MVPDLALFSKEGLKIHYLWPCTRSSYQTNTDTWNASWYLFTLDFIMHWFFSQIANGWRPTHTTFSSGRTMTMNRVNRAYAKTQPKPQSEWDHIVIWRVIWAKKHDICDFLNLWKCLCQWLRLHSYTLAHPILLINNAGSIYFLDKSYVV